MTSVTNAQLLPALFLLGHIIALAASDMAQHLLRMLFSNSKIAQKYGLCCR